MGVGTEGKKLWTERGKNIQAEEKKAQRSVRQKETGKM